VEEREEGGGKKKKYKSLIENDPGQRKRKREKFF
jgi:hypothetical protein